ncbi:MAG: histidinol-phosphatase HisJ family protein [Clostridia bacterium]|nr:histidinol-phosphatase HisJ family protein [Clostridia bacterium]
MYTDTHTHTTFSSDGKMSPEEAVIAAKEKNLSGIAFTDHFDYDYPGNNHEFRYSFDEYFDKIVPIKEKYAGDFSVYTAVEVGFQKHVYNEINSIINKYDFDFIIGSTHVINRVDPYSGEFYKGRSKEETYLEYIKAVYENVMLFDNYDAMGHFDYHIRYATMFKNRTFYYKDFSDYMDEIFKHLISKNIALEINTSTYQKVPLDTQNLIRYKELGGEMVTLGSDAHRVEDIARIFKEILPIIKDCGFDYIVHFEQRKPVFDKIIL